MENIEELVRTRIIVLRAANKLTDDVDMSVVENEYVYCTGIPQTRNCLSYTGFIGKSCEGAGRYADCFGGNGEERIVLCNMQEN